MSLRQHLLNWRFFLLNVGLFFSASALAQSPYANPDSIVTFREMFEFEVSYGAFDLGKVTVQPLRDTLWNGQEAWLLKSVVSTNPKLWFVGYKEEHFYGVIAKNDSTFFEYEYWKDDIDSEEFREEEYVADYQKGEITRKENGILNKVISVTEPHIFGLGFFTRARVLAGTGQIQRIPIIVDGEKKEIIVYHGTSDQKVEYATILEGTGGVIDAIPITAKANIKGPFGFNGSFSGFYTADERHLPVEANLKVWIGSISIKLKKYSRLQ